MTPARNRLWFASRLAVALILTATLSRSLPLGTAAVAVAAPAAGTVRGWGFDTSGQLGDGTVNNPEVAVVPQRIAGGSTNIIAVAAGAYHSLALRADGAVLAWGSGENGQLGDGIAKANYRVATPRPVLGLSDVIALAAGYSHSLALRSDGSVWAWGGDGDGQLGDGTIGTPEVAALPQRVNGVGDVIAIASGTSHNLALKRDGTVWTWGRDVEAQLGDGVARSPDRVPIPVQVSGGLTNITAIAAGNSHSLALRGDGTVWAWGSDSYNQLGRANTAVPNGGATPIEVAGLPSAKAIGAGGYHSLAVASNGAVWAWGWNLRRQIGDGSTGYTVVAPRPVSGGLTDVVAVTGGQDHSLALRADGSVWGWGNDQYAQLGDDIRGNPDNASTPQRVGRGTEPLTNVTAIAAGRYHSMALVTSSDSPPAPSPVPTFTDVPSDYWAYVQIGQFGQRGITTGCDTGLYCPERGVTRAEMAVFVDRTLGYSTPPSPTGQSFTDVPTNYWAYAFIAQFATLGITTGCGGTEFCPDRGVNRAEMAAFLIRALKQRQATPAVPTFADVPLSHPQYGYIEALVTLGVTTGCGTNAQGQRLFCPERGVNRAEMAVFIIRAYP